MEKELTPTEYFNYLKSKIVKIDNEELADFYAGCLLLVEKYKITGQEKIIRKMKFLVDCVDKEKEIIDLGVDQFVYREDIEDYIDNISKDVVKIIELENYPREIPDEIVDIIQATKNIFDQFYVVFTDYTGKEEKRIAKERRDRDPILFGTFQKKINSHGRNDILINDRFYYLGDWVDEYCDLTIDKFLKAAGKNKLHKIGVPKNIQEIQAELDAMDDNYKIVNPIKPNLFKRIHNKLKRRK